MSPDTIDLVQKGGTLVFALLVIGWLLVDRNRLLKALGEKDEVIAAKDDKLLALSERTLVSMSEFKAVVDRVADLLATKRR